MGEAPTGPAPEPRGLSYARTSFVGRSDAVDKVAGLLTQYRLVTVTGPGGVGKTRLAGEVLRQAAGRFADGVWVAELAAVADPAHVPAMVATVLGLREAAGVPIVDALATRLARQQLLLVMDNCEHVLDAVAELCATILLRADDIRILATSREPLGLPEEARYRLPALELPRRSDPDAPGQAEAVTLFVEHARQLSPDLTLDGEAGAIVARLVERLDGMPHAIELAAARVEALGLGQMLDRLDVRLLVSANRAAPARSRGAAMTLAAAVEFAVIMAGEDAPGTLTPAARPGLAKLSARERELVTLVARGRTDAQIAGQLGISVRTVRTHLDRIRDKSGCRRADLTRLALQEGII